ncbi:hypothetical protein RUND412_004115 [Rhizina undulata]
MTAILPTIKLTKSVGADSPAASTPITPASDSVGSFMSYNNDSNSSVGAITSGATASKVANGTTTYSKNSKAVSQCYGDSERLQVASSPSWGRKTIMKRTDTTTLDPLTMQILRRTGTENTIPQKLRQESNEDVARMPGLGESIVGGPTLVEDGRHVDAPPHHKEKKKGVSFLSRIMGGKKKGVVVHDEEEGTEEEKRTEGMDAAVFSQPIGYIPQFPAPPKYIRVRSHNKPNRDFNQIFLAQELYREPIYEDEGRPISNGSTTSLELAIAKHKSGAIWAMKFSKDGKYLAAGGQDKIVRVWQVLSSKEDRSEHEREEDAASSDIEGICSGGKGMRLNAPVFRSEPIHEYVGHTADVLDLSWSKNNFLLSSSMDKTVRLWHVTRKECLCCFQHSDFVTSIVFHPRDDRFFLAGSLDSKLRLWSIPDKSVAFWNELPDLITAVAFTPDGRMAIAGCLSGLCLFYETEGLRYNTQVHVRSSHGRNAKGSKITGIETITYPPEDPNGEVKVLITSNDSRVRMYNIRDKSLDLKFKGYENSFSQIHATFSDDGKYVISGSEDRKVYIWNVESGEGEKKDKRPVEFFEAHPAIVTVGILAPTKTRQLLGSSGDPVYDLCNPPPVTLVSRSESVNSRRDNESRISPSSDIPGSSRPLSKVPEESPAYAARACHSSGNIIVTADYTGRIKVFRQDCAHVKRKNESWETSSRFSQKIGTSIFTNSHRNSSQSNTDRNVSWRSSVGSVKSLNGSVRSNLSGKSGITAARQAALDTLSARSARSRSVSPVVGAMSVASSNGTTQRFSKQGSLRSSRRYELSKPDSAGNLSQADTAVDDEHLNVVEEQQFKGVRGKDIGKMEEEESEEGYSSEGGESETEMRCKRLVI